MQHHVGRENTPIPLVAHSTVNTVGTNDRGLCCHWSSKPTTRKREPDLAHALRLAFASFVLSACLLVFSSTSYTTSQFSASAFFSAISTLTFCADSTWSFFFMGGAAIEGSTRARLGKPALAANYELFKHKTRAQIDGCHSVLYIHLSFEPTLPRCTYDCYPELGFSALLPFVDENVQARE